MIGHCYKRSKMCSLLDEVYVATCDMEIFNYIESIGGKAVMTLNTHERASDRTAEALLKIEKSTNRRIDIVVMLQGRVVEQGTHAGLLKTQGHYARLYQAQHLRVLDDEDVLA